MFPDIASPLTTASPRVTQYHSLNWFKNQNATSEDESNIRVLSFPCGFTKSSCPLLELCLCSNKRKELEDAGDAETQGDPKKPNSDAGKTKEQLAEEAKKNAMEHMDAEEKKAAEKKAKEEKRKLAAIEKKKRDDKREKEGPSMKELEAGIRVLMQRENEVKHDFVTIGSAMENAPVDSLPSCLQRDPQI